MSSPSPAYIEPVSGLSYRVVSPAPVDPLSLVILLHGVGGSETDLLSLASGLPARTLVILPRGRIGFGEGKFGWFTVNFTSTGPKIDPIEAEYSRLAVIDFLEQIQKIYRVPASATVLAGFSQGGIISSSVALSSPESVRGFGILSGRVLPEIGPVTAASDRFGNLNGLITHGRNDATLPISWAEKSHELFERLGITHDMKLYAGGHSLGIEAMNDFKNFVIGLFPSDEAQNVT